MSCFALKKWITWNGNSAAKLWKIVPGPNICPKWAQLRSPWRSRRSGWAGKSLEGGTWRQWKGYLSLKGKSLWQKATNNTAPLFSPSLQKGTRDVPIAIPVTFIPPSPIFGIIKVIPYRMPRNCAQLVCSSYYAVTSLAYMLSSKSLNKDWVLALGSWELGPTGRAEREGRADRPSPSFLAFLGILLGDLYCHSLNFGVLSQTEFSHFSPISRHLESSKRALGI